MIGATLKHLGLNDKGIKVYLVLLRLGPSSVRKIAEEAEVNRGTTYDVLKELMELGLVSYYHKDKHQYFTPENPERLRDAVNQKWREMAEIEKKVSTVIPELQLIAEKSARGPAVRYCEGHQGVKSILQDVLEVVARAEEKEYLVYSSKIIREVLYQEYPNFKQDRVKKRIRVKVLAMGDGGELSGLDKRKFLNVKEDPGAYVIIYDDRVATISLNPEGLPVGIVVSNKEVAKTQRMLFNFIWEKLY